MGSPALSVMGSQMVKVHARSCVEMEKSDFCEMEKAHAGHFAGAVHSARVGLRAGPSAAA